MNPGEQPFFNALLVSSFVVAGLVFVVLFAIVAPSGRPGPAGWRRRHAPAVPIPPQVSRNIRLAPAGTRLTRHSTDALFPCVV